MRKLLSVIAICLLVCTSMALADNEPTREAVSASGMEVRDLRPRTRDACTLGYLAVDDPALILSYWGGWGYEDAYKEYFDVAVNQYPGTMCTPPLYPFLITSFDVVLVVVGDSAATVGQTLTFAIDIECPADFASPLILEACKGPGQTIC